MKLRNKKTGEIKDTAELMYPDGTGEFFSDFDSLAELNEEWEDYVPEDAYFLQHDGLVDRFRRDDLEEEKEIGNYFETKEEAEKAVEKLKAITRLNKCGFKFEGYDDRDRANGGDIVIYAHIDTPNNNLLEEAQPAMLKDLDLLFGGEA